MTTIHASTHSSAIARRGSSTSPTSNSSPVYSSVAVDDIELDRVHGEAKSLLQKGVHLTGEASGICMRCRNDIDQGATWRLLCHRLISRVLIAFVLLGLLYVLFLMVVTSTILTSESTTCRPDGVFSLSFPYDPWLDTSTFSIDIKFGNLTFAQAKFVDVCWDVGVGRGAQVILVMFTYFVFSRSLTCIMERSSVPYDTFKAITLQDNTFHGLLSLSRSLFRNKIHRTRGTIVWMIIASSFVLLVPTWLSAMTGYVTAVNPFVADRNGNVLPFNRFQPAIYTIHNGAILEHGHDEMIVTVPWRLSGGINTIQEVLDTRNVYGCGGTLVKVENGTLSSSKGRGTDLQCLWLWSVSYYVSQYGFLGRSPSSNTTFYQPNISDTLLADPVNLTTPLNISAHLALGGDPYITNILPQPYGRDWIHPTDAEQPFSPNNPIFWHAASGTIYNLTELNENGSCKQLVGQARYQWGFSHILLFFFALSLLIWVFGMWILHCDSLLRSRLLDRKMGYERAIMDISQSIPEVVHEKEDSGLQSNKELQALLRQRFLTYTTLAFDASTPTLLTYFKREFEPERWGKAEKWWRTALLIFSLLLVLSWTTPLTYFWSPFTAPLPIFGVLLVILVRREIHGRWIVFALAFAIFIGFDIRRILLIRGIWSDTYNFSQYWHFPAALNLGGILLGKQGESV